MLKIVKTVLRVPFKGLKYIFESNAGEIELTEASKLEQLSTALFIRVVKRKIMLSSDFS